MNSEEIKMNIRTNIVIVEKLPTRTIRNIGIIISRIPFRTRTANMIITNILINSFL